MGTTASSIDGQARPTEGTASPHPQGPPQYLQGMLPARLMSPRLAFPIAQSFPMLAQGGLRPPPLWSTDAPCATTIDRGTPTVTSGMAGPAVCPLVVRAQQTTLDVPGEGGARLINLGGLPPMYQGAQVPQYPPPYLQDAGPIYDLHGASPKEGIGGLAGPSRRWE